MDGAVNHTAPTTLQISVSGTLLADAEWRVTGGAISAGFIVVHIDQPGMPPIRAVQFIGSEPSRMLAGQAKARALRRGESVKVYGTKLLPHGDRSIDLLGVTDVIPMHVRTPATQEH